VALGARAIEALLVLALVRIGGLGPATVGLVFTVGSIGFVIGAVVVDRVIGRLGVGRSIVGAMAVICATMLAMAVAPDAAYGVAIGIAFCIYGVAAMIYNIASLSLRQTLPSRHLLGRVNAAVRMITWAAFPIGALLGGLLATIVGIRGAIALASVVSLLALVPLLTSPITRIRELDQVTAG
jgi:MFS family permease